MREYYRHSRQIHVKMKTEVNMTEREKMLAGQLYDCGDEELLTQWHKAKNLMRDYNRTDSGNAEEKDRILTKDIPDNVVAYGNPCRVMRPNQS